MDKCLVFFLLVFEGFMFVKFLLNLNAGILFFGLNFNAGDR